MNRKRINKRFFFYLLFLFVSGIQPQASAQNALSIDSLRLRLSQAQTVDDSVRALCRLAWFSPGSDSNLGFQYGQKALELSSRIQNMERIAEAYDAAALEYKLKNNTVKAKELYTKALQIGEEHQLRVRIAWENYYLAKIAIEQNSLDDARTYAEKSRAAFRSLNHGQKIIENDWLLIKTTRYTNSMYIDSAIQDYKRAISLTTDSALHLTFYLDLIHLNDLQENRTQMMQFAMKALETAEGVNDKKAVVKACYQIADYLRDSRHSYDIALLYYKKILEICETDSSELGVANILNEIGNVYKLLGNDSLAFANYYQSLHIAEKIKHRHSIANAYQNIGKMYFQKKNFRDAFTNYSKCYEIGCDKCPPIAFHSVLVDMGNVYLNAKDLGNALFYFRKSLLLADSAHAENEQAVSRSALADYYMAVNNSESALKNLHVALEYAVNLRSLSLQKEVSSKLSQVYRKSNNYQKAFEYLKLSNTIADSLKAISEADNLSRLETKFEFQNMIAQRKYELSEHQKRADAEITKQKQVTYVFVGAFMVVAAFGALIYLNLYRKKKYTKTLEEQKKQIEDMSEKVHEADQKKLNFFSNISHELRTPLTLILGPTEQLVKDHSSNRNALPLLQIIQRNTLQLYNLINQLLDIRKLDTGHMKLKVAKGDLVSYCRGVYSTFAHLAEAHAIRYTFSCPEDTITGWFSSRIIEMSLNNLLSNAFKYTPDGGIIEVSVMPIFTKSDASSKVRIIVRDNGKGIPEDQVQYVFDRYYQVENSNTGFNTGTGIGLAYTKELVGLHKGEIHVESALNKGTSFSLTIPIHDSDYTGEEKTTVSEEQDDVKVVDVRHKYLEQVLSNRSGEDLEESETDVNDNSQILLIVEDNSDVRTFIRNMFADRFRVYEAEDGSQGFQSAVELIPDIIISDIMMPGMNGLELCQKLKSTLQTSHIPILMLTAKAGDEHEVSGLQTGADGYLTKPFNSEILQARIDSLLEFKKRQREYFTREFLLNPREVVAASPEDEFLCKAVALVEEHIADPDLGVDMLMRELAVSRTQLFRKLKALTNSSANQFIRNIKLKRAAQLLRQNSYNVTDVLYLSGFNSPSYFSACFKEAYGCLPKEYASQQASASIPESR